MTASTPVGATAPCSTRKLRGTARIKLFLVFMRGALKRDADLFEGGRARP